MERTRFSGGPVLQIESQAALYCATVSRHERLDAIDTGAKAVEITRCITEFPKQRPVCPTEICPRRLARAGIADGVAEHGVPIAAWLPLQVHDAG
jgi:hypothetical protein